MSNNKINDSSTECDEMALMIKNLFQKSSVEKNLLKRGDNPVVGRHLMVRLLIQNLLCKCCLKEERRGGPLKTCGQVVKVVFYQ